MIKIDRAKLETKVEKFLQTMTDERRTIILNVWPSNFEIDFEIKPRVRLLAMTSASKSSPVASVASRLMRDLEDNVIED